jgi:hypothetical protein
MPVRSKLECFSFNKDFRRAQLLAQVRLLEECRSCFPCTSHCHCHLSLSLRLRVNLSLGIKLKGDTIKPANAVVRIICWVYMTAAIRRTVDLSSVLEFRTSVSQAGVESRYEQDRVLDAQSPGQNGSWVVTGEDLLAPFVAGR